MDLNRPIAPIADHQLEIVLLGPAAVPEGATVRSRPELAKLDVPVDADRGWNIFVSATGGVLAPHFVSRILSPEEAARQIDEFTRPR
jgi:hypothetical protein